MARLDNLGIMTSWIIKVAGRAAKLRCSPLTTIQLSDGCDKHVTEGLLARDW